MAWHADAYKWYLSVMRGLSDEPAFLFLDGIVTLHLQLLLRLSPKPHTGTNLAKRFFLYLGVIYVLMIV